MVGKIFGLLAAAGFAAAASLSAGGALADKCGKSYRAAPPSCVTWWYEGTYPYKKAYAKNNCEGEMVLKIDISGGGSDDRWHMPSGQERRETYGKTIRAVRCCTRMGDGCSQKEIHPDSCLNKYWQSSASQTCRNQFIEQSGGNCSIRADCDTAGGPNRTSYWSAISSFHKLQNCNGHLKIDYC